MRYDELPTYDRAGDFHVVVESPAGSRIKLKYEPELESFTVERPLVLGVSYPFDWGFVPRTREEIEQFFLTAVLLEGKGVKLKGWDGPKAAKRVIDSAATAYQQADSKRG